MVMMDVWFIGLRVHYGETAGTSIVRPLFLFFLVFLSSWNTFPSGIFGLGEPGTQGHLSLLSVLGLRFSMLGGG